jgi:hypothetical protein
MTLRLSRLPIALDPLIGEAKRRARRRRFLVAVSALTLVGLATVSALVLPSPGGGSRAAFAGQSRAGALAIPRGTDGIAVVVYGRLSVATKTGFDIHGLPVSAASLSPGARYVAAGIGNSLAEIAPGGRRIWSLPVGAAVANCGACDVVPAIAWSPDGSRIAYLVRTSTMKQVLHVIWRDGTHDTVIDSHLGGEQPSWRADSRALAYVGAGGHPVVYDLAHRSRHVITWPIARSADDSSAFGFGATDLAFAPRGSELAIGTWNGAFLVNGRNAVVWRGQTQAVNWLGDRLAVSERIAPTGPALSGRLQTQLYTVTPSGVALDRTIHLPGPVMEADGRTIALPGVNGVFAGRIGSLHKVFRFTTEPGWSGCACGPIPFGGHDISIG